MDLWPKYKWSTCNKTDTDLDLVYIHSVIWPPAEWHPSLSGCEGAELLSKTEMNSEKEILKSFRNPKYSKRNLCKRGLPTESIFLSFLTEVFSTKDLFRLCYSDGWKQRGTWCPNTRNLNKLMQILKENVIFKRLSALFLWKLSSHRETRQALM